MRRISAPACILTLILSAIAIAPPASAQIFWKAPDFSGAPMTALEPGFGVPLPGSNPAEQKAALIWNFRSGLNLAALQCGFEPLLRTEKNYNAILNNHRDELAGAYATLSNYFKRMNKTVPAGQKALDTYGTRTISSFSTVRGQLGFCHTAGHVGRAALFANRGNLWPVVSEHLRSLYISQAYKPDQQFRVYTAYSPYPIPDMRSSCWDKKNRYTCG